MPLFAMLAFDFAVGALAALAAARELRASPRAVFDVRAFRAVAWHEVLVAMPIAAVILVRHGDWACSYVLDAAAVPSVITTVVILSHGAIGIAGFALGARLLREHRAPWAAWIAGSISALAVIGLAVAHHRLGIVATYAQYHGGFGLRSFAASDARAALTIAACAWIAAVGHLLWFLARRV